MGDEAQAPFSSSPSLNRRYGLPPLPPAAAAGRDARAALEAARDAAVLRAARRANVDAFAEQVQFGARAPSLALSRE